MNQTPPPTFAEIFPRLDRTGTADPDAVREALGAILDGAWTPVQVAGFATALRMRADDPAIIGAAAVAMRAAMVPVKHSLPLVLDTCGTGGDGSGSLNLSTAAAIVVAAGGVPVAKHGNRAVSSKSGSADVLEALGLPIDLPPSAASTVLTEAGIAFLMAPKHHPAMRYAAQARKELGIRTIFNALGPLSNPARATHQLLGSYDDSMRDVFAKALGGLGCTRAWVVHGRDGLDEISPFGVTEVTELAGDKLTHFSVAPEDFGVTPSVAGAIDGGNSEQNAAALMQILEGKPHPATDAVVLNAAAAFAVALELSPRKAADRARELLATGTALRTLKRWRCATQAASRVGG